MRKLIFIATLIFNHLALANETVVIEDVTIISPHLAKPMQHMQVVIAQGRIEEILPSKRQWAKDVQIIDGRGLYLLPGIMDSHVHVSAVPGMGFGVEPVVQKHTELAEEYYRQQPLSFLYHGVTQVVDPNPGLQWQKFTAADAHPDYFRCEVIATANTFPIVEKTDALAKSMFPFLIDEGVDEQAKTSPEKVAKKIAESGAKCIKLYFEDGYGDDGHWPLLSDNTLRRIRLAATQNNLLIVAHANALDMYQKALAFDVDVIAHGLWNWGEFSRQNDITQSMAVTLDNLIEKGVGYIPTQRVIAGLGELMLQNSNQVADFNDVTPKSLLDWYQQPEADWFKQELRVGFDGLPDEIIARIFLQDRVSKGAKIIQHLNKADYSVLLGSDFPGSPSYANQPGLTTFLEMKAMAEAGLSLSQVLAGATINNARQFNMQKDYGTVEVGKVANLLLLTQSPLDTIDAWRKIRSVILHGEVFKRERFAANSMFNTALQQSNH